MNIARNMEAVFLAATLLAVPSTGATAQPRLDAQPALDGKVHTVVVSAKRLTPSTDLLVAAK